MWPAAILQSRLDALGHHGLVRNIDVLAKGHTRIETAFRYPDGSNMDLFISNDQGLLSGIEPIELTDFGYTLSWLAQIGINPPEIAQKCARPAPPAFAGGMLFG
jgi:hypothetical protein